MNKPYWFSIIVVSVGSIVITTAVWSAGSPQYGIISEVWRHYSVPMLLAISLSLLIVGASALRRGGKACGINKYVIPAIFLGLAAVSLVLVAALVIVKLAGIGG